MAICDYYDCHFVITDALLEDSESVQIKRMKRNEEPVHFLLYVCLTNDKARANQ